MCHIKTFTKKNYLSEKYNFFYQVTLLLFHNFIIERYFQEHVQPDHLVNTQKRFIRNVF